MAHLAHKTPHIAIMHTEPACIQKAFAFKLSSNDIACLHFPVRVVYLVPALQHALVYPHVGQLTELGLLGTSYRETFSE